MHPERTGHPSEPEGCLTAAIRIPVRIVVLVLVVPLRLGWDVLVLCGAFLRRMFRPVGRALAWFGDAVLAPVGRAVARVAEGVATACWWLVATLFKTVFYWPWLGLWRYVIVPVAVHGIAAPAAWLHRTLLAPLGRGRARGPRGGGAPPATPPGGPPPPPGGGGGAPPPGGGAAPPRAKGGADP
ncbi:hypothetical protein ACFV6U_32310, partial [Streptomyces sp. NPDC059810]